MAERNNLTSPDWRELPPTGAGDRSADEIRQDIAARRESISEAVDKLSDRFQRKLNWREYISDYPLVAIGAAAGMGYILGRIFKPRQSPGDRIKDALAYGLEDLTGRIRHQLDEVAPQKHEFGLGKTVKAAAAGLITRAVTEYLRNRYVVSYQQYPEYTHEYTNADDLSSY